MQATRNHNPTDLLLVTGAAGQVGTRVLAAARAAGVATCALARRAGPDIDVVADLLDPEALAAVPWGRVTAVIHAAAAVPARSTDFARDNLAAADALVRALADAPALRRVVHVSSVSVYARPSAGPWHIEEHAPVLTADHAASEAYGWSKLGTERALDACADRPGVAVTHLRASSIYGPQMPTSTLLPVLVGRARRGEALVLRGPRGYIQNFVHVDDVAALALELALLPDATPPVVHAFSADTWGLRALAEMVHTHVRSQSAVVDETTDVPWPEAAFDDTLARQFLPQPRALVAHLQEIP